MAISIIIPAFNASKTIGEQLAALAKQSWQGEYEVIVVDNGSHDQTISVAQSYSSKIKNLKVIAANAKHGAGYARNLGAKCARGDIILYCDADDVVDSRWVEEMAIALKENYFVCSRFDSGLLNNPTVQNTRYCPQQNGVQKNNYPPYLPHASAAGLGVRKIIHEQVGGFDESFYKLQDTDYCWRIHLEGVSLVYAESAIVNIRFRETKQELYKQAREWGEYNVKLYRKYRTLLNIPKYSYKQGIRRWLKLIKNVDNILKEEQRGRWCWNFYWSLGRLIGCVKYRVIAL